MITFSTYDKKTPTTICKKDLLWKKFLNMCHSVKNVRIRSFSGLYFPAFRLNTEYLSVFSPNAGKCGPEKLRIGTLFTLWVWLWIFTNFFFFFWFLEPCNPYEKNSCAYKKTQGISMIDKDVIRTLSNIYDGAFLRKYLMTKSSITDVWQSSTYISDGGLQL